MASNTKIQIKRSTTSVKPASLDVGELAYSFKSNTLFVGNTSGVYNVGGILYTSLESASSANGSATLVKRDEHGNSAFYKVAAVSVVASSLTGNLTNSVAQADQADRWSTARTLTTNGDITSNAATVRGDSDMNVSLTLTTTGVNAGTYGGSDQIPYFTVDSKGRLTLAGNNAISTPSTSWTVAGDTGSDSQSTGGVQTFLGGDGIDTVVSDGASATGSNVTIAVDNTVVRTSGDQTISGVKTFSGTKTIIQGDLQVTGTTIYANSTTLQIGDNIIVLNNDVLSGNPTESAGIDISRGIQNTVSLLWDETADAWSFSSNVGPAGSLYRIASNVDIETVGAAINYANTTAGKAFDAANNVGGAVTYANTTAGKAFDTANAVGGAVTYANTTVGQAFDTANAVGGAVTYANTTAGQAFGKANSANIFAFEISGAVTYANTTAGQAFDKANAANVLAFNAAPNTYVNNTFVKLIEPSQTITGNLAITGSLVVSGNAYTLDTETLKVSDPLIYLAGNNYTSDIVDIGFVGNYVNTTGSNVHTGFFRDATNKEYYIFQGYDKEPEPNHIDTAGNNFTIAVLNAYLKADQITSGTLPIARLPTVTVPYGGTGQTTFTANAVLLGNGTSQLSSVSSTTEGHVLKISVDGYPEFGMLDGGSF